MPWDWSLPSTSWLVFWDYQLNQPSWWVTLLLGAFLATIVPIGFFSAIIQYTRRRVKQDHLLGSWYYYSGGFVQGRPRAIRECRFQIKRGFLSPYIGYSFVP